MKKINIILYIALFLISSCSNSLDSADEMLTNNPKYESMIGKCETTKAQIVSFFAHDFKRQLVDSLPDSEVTAIKLYTYDLTGKYSDSLSISQIRSIMDVSRDSAYAFYEHVGSSSRMDNMLMFDKELRLIQPYKTIGNTVELIVKLIYTSEECNNAIVFVEALINPDWGYINIYELYIDDEEWKIKSERTVVVS